MHQRQKTNNSTKKHAHATKLSRKETKPKPHLQNTKVQVSVGGKVNWNPKGQKVASGTTWMTTKKKFH